MNKEGNKMQDELDRKHESEGMKAHDEERDALRDLDKAKAIKDREDESMGMHDYDEHHDHHHDERRNDHYEDDDSTAHFIDRFMARF